MKWVLSLFILTWITWSPVGAASGDYVFDVRKERQERFYEIFLFVQPPPQERPLSEYIFNAELSREFRTTYRDRFGQLDTESIAYQRTDFSRLEANKAHVRDIEAHNAARRAYAEYMMKRLAEWHVDNYVKSEPAMRPVYEAKEKLKNVEVKVNQETKLRMQYSLAGNTMDFILENPYVDSRLFVIMDPKAFGPTSPQDRHLILGKSLPRRFRLQNVWYEFGGMTFIELIKSHTPRFSTSYGLLTAYQRRDFLQEQRYTWGLGYSF